MDSDAAWWAFRRYGGTRTAGRGPTGILPPPPLIAPRLRLTTAQVWSRHSGRAATGASRFCYAGEAVGLVTRQQSAADVIHQLGEGAEGLLRKRFSSLLEYSD